VKNQIILILVGICCPHCEALATWKYHGRYYKYLGANLLWIIRSRCTNCGKTHALIPWFSLPYTSLSTHETEQWFQQRMAGQTRKQAVQGSSLAEHSDDFLRRLERRMRVAVNRAKAILPNWGEATLHDYAWVQHGSGTNPLTNANLFCLEQIQKPFFGGTLSGTTPLSIAGIAFAHKKATGQGYKPAIDSS
jgi:hypothetical protein